MFGRVIKKIKVKIRMRLDHPESFIEVDLDEYGNNNFRTCTVEDANLLLTRAKAIDSPEPDGSYSLNTIGIFAQGTQANFEFEGAQKTFTFAPIPYERIINGGLRDSRALADIFSKRIKDVRGWTDQQIEVEGAKVSLEDFDKPNDGSSIFIDDGKMHVLIRYLLTTGPHKNFPNIKVFIDGTLQEDTSVGHRPNAHIRVAAENIVAKGIKPSDFPKAYTQAGTSYDDYLNIFTPELNGHTINYEGKEQEVEAALRQRIKMCREMITDGIGVEVFVTHS